MPTTLTLNNSVVKNNSAGGDGGGIANGIPLPGPMPLPGGALTLNHSQVTGNTAAHGGGIFNNGGTVTLTGQLGHRQHPGQLRAPGHHHRLHRLTGSPPSTPLTKEQEASPSTPGATSVEGWPSSVSRFVA